MMGMKMRFMLPDSLIATNINILQKTKVVNICCIYKHVQTNKTIIKERNINILQMIHLM